MNSITQNLINLLLVPNKTEQQIWATSQLAMQYFKNKGTLETLAAAFFSNLEEQSAWMSQFRRGVLLNPNLHKNLQQGLPPTVLFHLTRTPLATVSENAP